MKETYTTTAVDNTQMRPMTKCMFICLHISKICIHATQAQMRILCRGCLAKGKKTMKSYLSLKQILPNYAGFCKKKRAKNLKIEINGTYAYIW